jgi:cystathionine beta-lyase family protein involved in aluminum resistance
MFDSNDAKDKIFKNIENDANEKNFENIENDAIDNKFKKSDINTIDDKFEIDDNDVNDNISKKDKSRNKKNSKSINVIIEMLKEIRTDVICIKNCYFD